MNERNEMDTIKLNPQKAAERFYDYVSTQGNRFNMLMDAYGQFQDGVALWQDDKYVIMSLAEEAMEYQMATKMAKQAFRGDELSAEQLKERNENVAKELGDVWFFFYANCKLWGLDPLNVIQNNVRKLADRAARNVIKGDGDKR